MPNNFDFVQKKGVRGAISQKRGIAFFQDSSQIEAFCNPKHLVWSEFVEVKVTLETNCSCTSDQN